MLKAIVRLGEGIYSLLVGLRLTLKSFFRPPVTLQYPLEKRTPSPGYRGILGMYDFFDEKSIDDRSSRFPGTEIPPCTDGCPANTPAREYVTLTAEGKYQEAILILKRHYPFLGTLGRVCSAPCELVCNRGQVVGSEPIAIRKIKRFLGDYEISLGPEKRYSYAAFMEPSRNKRVAVLGAGPAGLMTACALASNGYRVTIFERHPVPGGYLATGIPKYRLSRDVLNTEIKDILDMGVELKCGVTVGKDLQLDDLPQMGFDAIFIGVGAIKPLRLGVDGEELKGVVPAEDFLEDLNLGRPYEIGKRVAVIGGGFTSMDASRSSRRLGAEVHLFYRRTQHEMLASRDEIEDALEEGVAFHFLAAPVKVCGNGRVNGIELVYNKLGEFDSGGRRRPTPVKGSEFIFEADTIQTAISRAPDLPWLPKDIEVNRNGTIKVDEKTLESSRKGVFAGGDVIRGPMTVIQAVADGKVAASSIHEYLSSR